jgi:glycerol-3-phosphate dehydrogenase
LGADTVARLSSYGANSRAILDIIRQEPLLAERIVPDLPYIMAEVVYACRYEMAMELADVLERRLRIGIEDWSHGVDAAPRIAALMAAELGWGEAEVKCRLERYGTLIAEQYPYPKVVELAT